MSAASEASRTRSEDEKRSGASGREAALAAMARSPRRSSLFWWLFDNYDDLVEAKGLSALGFPWKSMCRVFAELGLTLAGSAPITPERARQTWWRVRKEKARLREAEAKAEAERAFQRARDPRRNMPSRFNGSYSAPLADKQPPRVEARPVSSPLAATIVTTPCQMPGDPVLTGGIEETLPASEFTVIFEGAPLDLRLFIAPNDKRPWDLPEFSADERIRVLKTHLEMRFDAWKRDRVRNPYNRVDIEWRKRLGKS
jgi:hypothetical protein